MKIQAINNNIQKTNANINKRNVNFGWFGGPMEQNITSKTSQIKDFKYTMQGIGAILKEAFDKIFTKSFWFKNTH